MLRKHFNSLGKDDLHDLPFYSWQCLTLVLDRREINLVITDKSQMDMLLKFLIHRMRTLDGKAGSANKLLDTMNEKDITNYKRTNQKKVISEVTKHLIRSQNEHMIFRKVFLKYLVMRVRSKISFMAFFERQTITEFMIIGV